MAKRTIKPGNLGAAIEKELTIYHESRVEKINARSEEAVKALVKKTKATAPKKTGDYRKNIASKLLKQSRGGNTYVWYVKPPDHRLTHLLVHPHETVNGGRTTPDPFLQNALDAVLPDYEKSIEEAIKGD